MVLYVYCFAFEFPINPLAAPPAKKATPNAAHRVAVGGPALR